MAAARRIRRRLQHLLQNFFRVRIWWQAFHRPFALWQIVAGRVVLEQIFAAYDGSDHVQHELAVDADRADHERRKPSARGKHLVQPRGLLDYCVARYCGLWRDASGRYAISVNFSRVQLILMKDLFTKGPFIFQNTFERS